NAERNPAGPLTARCPARPCQPQPRCRDRPTPWPDATPPAPVDPLATRSRAPPTPPRAPETWGAAFLVPTGFDHPRSAAAAPRGPPAPGRSRGRGRRGCARRGGGRDPERVLPGRGPPRRGDRKSVV